MGSGKPPLILAAGSPRRKALLEDLGSPIRAAVPGVEEEGLPLPPKALAQALADDAAMNSPPPVKGAARCGRARAPEGRT